MINKNDIYPPTPNDKINLGTFPIGTQNTNLKRKLMYQKYAEYNTNITES